ncbi:MAG: protein kinase [Kiritimatiellia bacterium]
MDVSRMPKEGDRFGNWIIERTLDKGGMGQVYLAYNPDLGKSEKVALKVLDPTVAERDADFVKRFYQEASIVFKTHCPHLVSIHDAGRDASSGCYYIVMEHLGGGTLRDRIRSRGRIPWREALSVVRSVAVALAAVAKRNSVHRDIKPENIMFTADGVVKLADFGIAKAAQDDVPDNADPLKTRALQIFGTPSYMSPEQMSDASNVDARADIWSLGVVLFEMLAGARPYPAQDLVQAGAFLLSPQPFPDIRTFKAPVMVGAPLPAEEAMQTQATVATLAMCADAVEVPDEVADLLARMCDKDLGQRIATSEAVIEVIDRLLKDSDSTSAEAPAAARLASATRHASVSRQPHTGRKRWLLRIACAALAVILGVLGAFVLRQPHPPATSAPVSPNPTNRPASKVQGTAANAKTAVSGNVMAKPPQPLPPVAPTVSPAPPSGPTTAVLRTVSQVSVFQPQRGSIASVLSQLDAEIGKKPVRLKVSLSALAQLKDLSVERYEQQLLVPAIERLQMSGVSFSLVPGPGKYGSVVRELARRFGCDLD